ncbi:MAG TPA: class I SAM-dependent methyltransferase [Anaerolineales bacterium]
METIRGKTSRIMSFDEFKKRLAGYNRILLDLGTGDGRYGHTLAAHHPDWFVIGIDACRENLHERSHAAQANLLFLIAEAQHLPRELNGSVSRLVINFPRGSLLEGLVTGDPLLMNALASVASPGASLEVRLNAGALAEAGCSFESGTERAHRSLLRAGWVVDDSQPISTAALRTFPSTWARRLAFGRDPRAFLISGWIAR